ncbi:MAG: MFS transporter [Bacillus thermozeamaize]|uniref:MFS transporter n=1 Tax=Bacillus thermozeamaize TaxID=230954 RepID=A0A1Y3PDP8_9BACI|nr:MAG: MFS transporter [Bacillus thermozeamaize]
MGVPREAAPHQRVQEHQTPSRRPLVLAAVLMAMFMAAVEGTIVATAMPSIVGDLGGFPLYSWVFSIFLLTQAISIPIYGRLADLYGRKPVFAAGAGLFLLGSLLCGLARSMEQLILFRAIQGLGAGAVQPIVTTIIGDIYTPEERAQIQGYLSSVWGISSVIGPALGGLIVQYADWALVFWLNLPLGLLSIAGILLFLHEDVEKKRQSIDYLGSALMLVSVSALMLAMIQGGVAWPWLSVPSLILLGIFVLGLLAFLRQEARAKEPMMPLYLWKHRVIGVANLASLINGMLLMGVSTFLPAYIQGVMGKSAMVAGFSLSMMSIGWPLASTIAGRLLFRLGARNTSLIGGVFLLLGAAFFITLGSDKGAAWAAAGSFLTGAGLGFCTLTFIVSIQSSVDWSLRGAATASNMFMRTLGSTVGAALLGGVLNTRLFHYLQERAVELELPGNLEAVNVLLDPGMRQRMSPENLQVLTEGMSQALHTVYLVVGVFAVLSLLLVWFLPRRQGDKTTAF